MLSHTADRVELFPLRTHKHKNWESTVIRKVMPLSCTPHLMLHPLLLVVCKVVNLKKKGYEILRLGIKCTRLENTYSYSTYRNSSDWLKAFRKRKDRANSV
jgi:hypothetical protein